MDIKKELKQIKDGLDRHEKKLSKLESLLIGKHESRKKKLSLREFILLKNLSDDVQRTLCIGYFLENYDDLSSFNKNDIETGFRRAREKLPLNINDKINLNFKKGCIDKASEEKDNLKAWVLTNTGQEEVGKLGKKNKAL